MIPALLFLLGGSLWGQIPTTSVQLVPSQAVQLPPLSMEDQYERPRQLAGYRGHVVVLLYGDRGSAESNKRLGEQLHIHFHPGVQSLPPDKVLHAPVLPVEGVPSGTPTPDVVTLPVACIGNVPALVRGLIRLQIRLASPVLPVWLDFDDQMKGRFGLTPGMPNGIIVDSLGRLRYTFSGPITPELVGQMIQAIAALRREAVLEEKSSLP